MLHVARVSNGRKSIILRVLLLIFSIYIIISLSNLQIQLLNRKKELKSGEAVLESKNMQIDELVRLLDNGSESELIEKTARERLGYVYPDEQIYVDLSGK